MEAGGVVQLVLVLGVCVRVYIIHACMCCNEIITSQHSPSAGKNPVTQCSSSYYSYLPFWPHPLPISLDYRQAVGN